MAMTDGKGGLMTEVEEACFHAKRGFGAAAVH